MNFVKFLRTTFLQNASGRLLPTFVAISLLNRAVQKHFEKYNCAGLVSHEMNIGPKCLVPFFVFSEHVK